MDTAREDGLGPLWEAGYALERQRRFAEAEECYRRHLQACLETHGPDHPQTHAARCAIAGAMVKTGRSAQAEELYTAALAALLRLEGGQSVRAELAAYGLCQTIEMEELAAGRKSWDRRSEMLGLTSPSGQTGGQPAMERYRRWWARMGPEVRAALAAGHETARSVLTSLLPEPTPPPRLRPGKPLRFGCEILGKQAGPPGTGESGVRVTCPQCGLEVAPYDESLARHVLRDGAFIVMKCPRCDTHVEFGR